MSDLEDSGQIERVYQDQEDQEFENAGQSDYQENHHIDYYRDEDDKQYDPDMSFERDTKRLTKVKAKLMFNLNKERKQQQAPEMYQDVLMTSVAMQYACSLKDNPNNEAYLKRLKEQQKVDVEFKKCQLISNYEEDIQITRAYSQKFFEQTSYLFWEMDQERQTLMDPNNTHVGIGLAGNSTSIVVVWLVVSRELTIHEIKDCGEGKVEVRGKMLDSSLGLVGARIFNNVDYIDQAGKQIYHCLYDKIDYSKLTREFVIYMELNVNWKQRRWIQLFMKDNPDTIQYKKPLKDKKHQDPFRNFNKKKILSLFMLYPDESFVREYTSLAIAQNEKLQQQHKVGLILMAVQDQIQKQEEEKPLSINEGQSQKIEDDEDDEEDQQIKNNQQNKEPATSNKQIKEELIMAIGQAKNTYDQLVQQNRLLQQKIKEIREKNFITLDKTNEASMNQHKYLNILAQVHQTRLQLQQTQDRYNRMSYQLQNKLNQKQSKCNQIRNSFQELKREVAKKATYSRSDLPIKPHRIQQWEDRQHKLTEQLQNLRLQILRARNSLAKNQKILKKKEQLAEGLHLIDFQQLKIENQTLNEKIEERNEDLHKLKKKTTTMVQILTHTRQKLIFVQKMKNNLTSSAEQIDAKIQSKRLTINQTKQNCQKLRLEIQDAKHKTQIVNSQELVVDYKKRTLHIQKLQTQIDQMLEKEKEMKTVIEMYQRKIRKQVVSK